MTFFEFFTLWPFIVLLFFCSLIYFDIVIVPKRFKDQQYAFKLGSDILLYASELIFFFLLFLWLTRSEWFLIYSSNEPSLLKTFIDFFTLYQIGILVLLKMLNSRIIQEYYRCLTFLQSIRNMIEADQSVFSALNELKNKQEEVIPLKVKEYYRDVYFVALNHEFLKTAEMFSRNSNPLVLNDIKQKIISSNNKAISNLNATEISITSLVTDKQNEWEVSMFIKVIKRWENTLQRKDVGDEEYWLEREGIIVFLENEIKKLRSLMNK
ncbi:hypothetical protein [Exiguobacterium marinum]|uniref:hypothetical protein n=1 Tax=Exiguobacterium marinum TaxID=273528 RepID=UPI0004795EEA|nr:hypothetical protein [Exiguobacterium marinum]